ncbi:MAG: inorganic diphosphatase [Bacteroidetes bacterium]|nr:inorganic diphosphatase [Bacteroidota bacterium]
MDTIEIVIETPRGSVEKYSFDKERKVFKLKKILPTGMSFPYDFGFIPDTKGEDGDPLDVVLLSEFKSFPGCYMDCRIIGVLICEQGEEGKTIRNDRYVAVPSLSTMFRDFKSVKELPEDKLDELEQFFINYNRIRGKKFKLLKIAVPTKPIKCCENNCVTPIHIKASAICCYHLLTMLTQKFVSVKDLNYCFHSVHSS